MLRSAGVECAHFPSSGAHHLGRNADGAELVRQLDRAELTGWTHLVLPSTQVLVAAPPPELRERLAGRPVVHESADCRIHELERVPVLVHVGPAVQDPDIARDHLTELLVTAGHDVVHMRPTSCPTQRAQCWSASPVPSVGPWWVWAAVTRWRRRASPRSRRCVRRSTAMRGRCNLMPALIDDAHPVHLLGEPGRPTAPSGRARLVELVDEHGGIQGFVDEGPGLAEPTVSIVVATRDRAELLAQCLEPLHDEVASRADVEVVVVDDGRPTTRAPSSAAPRWSCPSVAPGCPAADGPQRRTWGDGRQGAVGAPARRRRPAVPAGAGPLPGGTGGDGPRGRRRALRRARSHGLGAGARVSPLMHT